MLYRVLLKQTVDSYEDKTRIVTAESIDETLLRFCSCNRQLPANYFTNTGSCREDRRGCRDDDQLRPDDIEALVQ